ncbi:MAG: ATP-binding protein [Armatimonadetes bacterium]|nr:ATP-binding protein [Armatimonadota bacterium]
MSLKFAPASRQQTKVKLAISGPSGSGKTEGALRVARGLAGPTGRIAVVDSEHGSAALYSDRHQFDHLMLDPPYDAPTFAAAIEEAEKAGYDVLVIDTMSHAWEAVLDYKDALDRTGRGNSYTNWGAAGERWRQVVGTLLKANLHVIATLRAKTDYVVERDEKTGKNVPRKVGMAPIARDGTEYEFTLLWELDMYHRALASKDRTRLFDGKAVELTPACGEALVRWLQGQLAAEPAPEALAPDEEPPAAPATVARIEGLWAALGKDQAAIPRAVKWAGADGGTFADLTASQAEKLLAFLCEQMNALSEKKVAATKGAGLAEPQVDTQGVDPETSPVPPELAAWFGAHDEQVNAYLLRVKWIAEGQTWRALPAEKCASILARKTQFARAAGIPALKVVTGGAA